MIETVKDPIAYWDSVSRSSKGNPGAAALARMALDFLTVPGECHCPLRVPRAHVNLSLLATSTDAERAFSRGGLTVSRLCHSLNDASVHASALLASWSSIPDIVPETETIALLKAHIRKNCGGRDDDDGPPGGLAGVAKGSQASCEAPGISRTGSKRSSQQSRPSTPSGAPAAGSSHAASAVPGPSVIKPKAVSR